MLIKSEYKVNFPLEAFAEWMKERAMDDGIISENSDFIVENVSLDKEDYWLVVEGDIWTNVDS